MPSRYSFGEPRYDFPSLDTTMREATERAERGAPEGTLIVAYEQTSGRGRLGRSWVSQPSVGLYFSLVLRPPLAPAAALALTLAAGLGVARGVGESCGRRCDLRWPNDVLLGGKKCCGVLVEMTAAEERVRHAVVGVGVNVNQRELPAELASIATSLHIETGCEYLREAVLEAVLRRMEQYYEMFLERGTEAIVTAFSRSSSYVRGKRVVIENGPEEISGTTAGLDERGVLLLDVDGRGIEPILAGGVRPAPIGETGESDAIRG